MADPWAVVPYHDPHDDSQSDHLLQFFHAENPTLDDIYDPPSNHIGAIPIPNNVVGEPSYPIHGAVMADAGPSNHHGASSVEADNFFMDYGIVPSEPFNCSLCQLLRAITHTNGIDTTRLEIHGQIGTISHVLLLNSIQQYQMIHFSTKSIEEVKQFLMQYLEARQREGYVVAFDPLAEFYEALSVGVGRVGNISDLDDFFQLSIASSEASETEEVRPRAGRPRPSNRNLRTNRSRRRISLSEQRARTGKMTILDLAGYFHLRIEDAAVTLETCPTVLKKICRRHGIYRWPHRKIKCIDGRISKLKTKFYESTSMEERRSVKAEIEKDEEEIAEICFGIPRAPPCRPRKN